MLLLSGLLYMTLTDSLRSSAYEYIIEVLLASCCFFSVRDLLTKKAVIAITENKPTDTTTAVMMVFMFALLVVEVAKDVEMAVPVTETTSVF